MPTAIPADPRPTIAAVLSSPAIEALADMVEAGGLVPRRTTGVVLVSGGADSACAAAALATLCGPEAVAALHVNYGLRPDSGRDEHAARALCAKLRIDLHVERPSLGSGNLQARARDARYALAERLRDRLGADWIATGHTRTDVAETLLYRLAVSPGMRPLLGLAPRNGHVVRPLHAIARAETRAVAEEASLPFVDDPTNASPRFARNRIRSEVLPVLAAIGPEAERNIAATHAELHEEAELLRGLVANALDDASVAPGSSAIGGEALASMEPGLPRLVLRALAERASGAPVALSRSHAAQVMRLLGRPEGGVVELGGGVRALCEGGRARLVRGGEAPPPPPARLQVPGAARFGEWELRAELREAADGGAEPHVPDRATLDAARLGEELEVRAWSPGDRMRPLGLGGSKSLQDLFTDRGVPRSERAGVPVVWAGERVAWVAGVAVGDDFRIVPSTRRVAVISTRRVSAAEPRRRLAVPQDPHI